MKSQAEVNEADAWLEEAAAVLEGMARELRRLKLAQRTKIPVDRPTKMVQRTKTPGDQPTSGGDAEMHAGQRVQVVRKDQYRGQTGVVLGRLGRVFWDVQLDASATHGKSTI
jgi:transglutaminase-like putative cysteine protease